MPDVNYFSCVAADVTWCLDELDSEGKVAYFETPLFNRYEIQTASCCIHESNTAH